MAKRTDQLTETRSADHEVALGESEAATAGARRRVRERAETLFSPKRFGLALALVLAGTLVGGATVPIAGGVVGAFLGAFLLGVASETRPVAEAGVAGGAVVGLSTASDYLVWIIAGSGLTVAALGAVVGLVVCGLGAYFGSDLRDGLTREI
ncbi:hypothetical protein [Halalkalicoccus subterraneus]|uniref:hypothetical protein n=1 Tax=Halalkalicoccus subterraneus TaxID=2675002 RepID=UPI000EFB295F|nr:hypothetical protein [Halalkalicoccus subterraneus]